MKEKRASASERQHPCGERGETLRKYFQDELPDCDVFCRIAPDSEWFRFNFAKGNEDQYILDVHRNVLADSKPEKVIERLKREKWKEVLKDNQKRRIACFTNNGFEKSLPWPH